MARYAIVEGGIVANIIEADAAFAAGAGAIPAGDAHIGSTWDGTSFSPPPEPVPVVPQAVTMRQARLALLAAGKLAAVGTAIAALPAPQRAAAEITWEFSTEVQRHNGLVAQLGPALGLTEADVDALFMAAGAL